jgi:hypothetical protein
LLAPVRIGRWKTRKTGLKIKQNLDAVDLVPAQRELVQNDPQFG